MLKKTLNIAGDTINIGIDEGQYYAEIIMPRRNACPVQFYKNLDNCQDDHQAEKEAIRQHDRIKFQSKDHYAR